MCWREHQDKCLVWQADPEALTTMWPALPRPAQHCLTHTLGRTQTYTHVNTHTHKQPPPLEWLSLRAGVLGFRVTGLGMEGRFYYFTMQLLFSLILPSLREGSNRVATWHSWSKGERKRAWNDSKEAWKIEQVIKETRRNYEVRKGERRHRRESTFG